jgi:hypothetical protein
MRWLIIALLVSLAALLAVSAGLAHHIRRAHKRRSTARQLEQAEKTDPEEAP